MLPVWTFIITYFVLHLFDWMEATQFVIAVFISLLTLFVMIADFKEENKDKLQFTKLNLYVGVLTFLFIVIFLSGFLHWNRMIDISYRMAILFSLILIYFIILFRAIRVLAYYKSMAENK